jgi:hypothetical protein
MEVVTLAFNRPDFLELQLNSLKKWVKEPFKFTVFDNCPDDAIKDECDRLGIECVPIKIFSADTSWAVGLSLNKMWERLKHNKGKLWYIDSDMFLVNKLPDIKADFAFVPQKRGEYTYPWTGLMYFNMDTLPHPEELQWQVDYSVKDTDVGGRNHFYLQEQDVVIQELEMWTLIDTKKYSFNGIDSEGYIDHIDLIKLVDIYSFPKPYSVDMFKMKDTPFFVFHYKSASNYPSFYTPEYNRLKTQALCKLLMS